MIALLDINWRFTNSSAAHNLPIESFPKRFRHQKTHDLSFLVREVRAAP